MRLVVRGCGGFIGSHLLDRLMADGSYEVEGWDPDVRKIESHIGNPRLRLHRATIQTAGTLEAIESAMERADAVLNLAAICHPADYDTRTRAS